MDPVVRKVALTQLLKMSSTQLLEWATALDLAPPVPPPFAGTEVANAPMDWRRLPASWPRCGSSSMTRSGPR